MSVLTYDGITLPYSNTTSFTTEAVCDDMSDTDVILIKYDITVQCVINHEMLDLLGADLIGRSTNPAEIMNALHAKLMARRKRLSFTFDGAEFIPGRAGVQGTVDAMNGPKPQSFTYTQLNNVSWLVQYRIIAHYRVNLVVSAFGDDGLGRPTYSNLPGNVVLFNRWEESVDLDDCQFTTRTRSGKLMIRSDNDKGYIADMVREQMAVVSVPPGCVRQRSKYKVSPDGLGLQYEVTDREVYRMPPAPGFFADGDYEEEAARADGKRHGHVRLTLRAAKGVSQYKLLDTACGIAAGILDMKGAKFFSKNPDMRGYLLGARAKVSLYSKNEVAVQMSAFYPIISKRAHGMAFLKRNICDVPQGSSDGENPRVPYTSRGTAGLLLQAAKYYDPDLAGTELVDDGRSVAVGQAGDQIKPGGNQLSAGLRPGEAGKTPE